jgi:hypothetical protein
MNSQMHCAGKCHYARELIAFARITACNKKGVKREAYNNVHSDVKLSPEFFVAMFVFCISFPDKTRDVSTQLICFEIWPRIGH